MESFSEFPTKKSMGVTTNFEEAPDDSSVLFLEQDRKVKNSENEESFKQTTLEINKEIQTKSEITKSSLLPSTLSKQVTSSGEKRNFKTTATLVINKNDDTSTMLSSYNTTPMGTTHNVFLSDTKPSMEETTSFEHTQHETSVSFLEKNTKNKISGNEEIIDQTTFKTNVELLNRSEMKQSTVLPNIPYEHFTFPGEMGNFKFTTTLGRNKNDDTSNNPSNSKTTPMGTNIELFSDTKTPKRVTTSLEHTQENTIIPFLEQNTEIKKSEYEESLEQTTFETNVETHTRLEIKQSTVTPNKPYEHFTSSEKLGNFKFTATLGRNKNDDTSNSSSNSNTTPIGTKNELLRDTKTSMGFTTNFEHTQDDTGVQFLEQKTEIEKYKDKEKFGTTTLETSHKTKTISEIKQSTLLHSILSEHFTSPGENEYLETSSALEIQRKDATTSLPSINNITPDYSTFNATNDKISVTNEDLRSSGDLDDGFNSSGDIDYLTTAQTSIVNWNVKSSNEEVKSKRKNGTPIRSINSNVATTTEEFNTIFAGGNGNSNTASRFFSNPAVSRSKSVITSTLSSTLSNPKPTHIISLPITTIPTTGTGVRRTLKKHNVSHFNIQFDVKQEKTIITSLASSTKATELAPKLGSSNALSLSAIKYHIYILIIFIMNMFVT
ncbi:unnamed protein product [Mytilus edulis]|uniref:Uncharacterized protein n=1 Tax=Mytilus edulis TaxID=6550 RepID=A0A8S3PYJ1_MYTED|nr:unnamed protein product [Mytilus edulis]